MATAVTDKEAVQALKAIESFGRSPIPTSQVYIEHLEGAVAQSGREDTAFSHRDTRYRAVILGLWTDPDVTDASIAWVRDYQAALQAFSTGGVHVNYLGEEGEDRVKAAYEPEIYARLAALKAKYDPTNFFRLNQNIKPA